MTKENTISLAIFVKSNDKQLLVHNYIQHQETLSHMQLQCYVGKQ